jgi:ribosomal protein S18 acetylase RimI-like enzyme
MSTNGDVTTAWKITENGRAMQAVVLPIVYEGINELAQEGHLVGKGLPFPVHPTDTVIYATSPEGDVIGLICYRKDEREITLSLCYVEPSSRRQGVMRSLWDKLVEREEHNHEVLVRLEMSHDNQIGAEVASRFDFVKAYAGWCRLLTMKG